MRINFVLPHCDPRVSGGMLVVFEYANRLANVGHEVSIILPTPSTKIMNERSYASARSIKQIAKRLYTKGAIPWFSFREGVKIQRPIMMTQHDIRDADVTVATAWHTAEFVEQLPSRVGAKVYFIQHYEVWDGPKEKVDSTFSLDLHKIVISQWLRDTVTEIVPNHDIQVIHNGIDLQTFHVTRPIQDRTPQRVGMLWHPNPTKASALGVEAFELLRARGVHVQPVLFGHPERPDSLPEWFEYYSDIHGEELVDYYNSLSIFMHTSLSEGWGLPALEAQACGAALVAARNNGVREFTNSHNTDYVDVGSVEGLADRVESLLNNDLRRKRLAERGAQNARHYSWSAATSKMTTFLESLADAD